MLYPVLILKMVAFLLLQEDKQVHIIIVMQIMKEMSLRLVHPELMLDMYGIMIILFTPRIVV